ADTTPPGTASPLLAGIIGSVVVLLALLTTSLLAATLRRYRARRLTAGRAVSLPSDCADKETADGISVNGDITPGEYSSGSLAGGSHLLLPVRGKGGRRSSSSGGMQDFCREFAHLESSAAGTPTPAVVQPERDIEISRNATLSPGIQESTATNPALYSCGYRYIRRGSDFTCNDISNRNEIPQGNEQRHVGFRVDESLHRQDRAEESGSLDRRSMSSRINDLRKEIGVNDDVMWGSPGHSTGDSQYTFVDSSRVSPYHDHDVVNNLFNSFKLVYRPSAGLTSNYYDSSSTSLVPRASQNHLESPRVSGTLESPEKLTPTRAPPLARRGGVTASGCTRRTDESYV
ncbi:uncharacterized protein LOC125179601, partial [Hyalella azteca]|uniref:Uncharacterized protein LOC125179601 n=1 Tax=Hyalella azteca TaxID=294128 RepID=A0A979FYK5_HYAAZ